jgi:hypothetical protein
MPDFGRDPWETSDDRRRAMDDRVEVQAGDVLLFHGSGFIPWGIRTFDGTDVNHAAIALDATTLGEAGGRGLQRTLIETAVKSNTYMRVRRHTDPELAPVLTVASTYLDDGRPTPISRSSSSPCWRAPGSCG